MTEVSQDVQIQSAPHLSSEISNFRRVAVAITGGLALVAVTGCESPAHPLTELRAYHINTTMGPSDEALDRLGNCESGNNPESVSATGSFRGEFQFNQGTWDGVVGGDGQMAEYVGVPPNKAPRRVQRAAARVLYAARGRSPWPVCGRNL